MITSSDRRENSEPQDLQSLSAKPTLRITTTRVRYHLVALLSVGTAVNYLDRVNISVAAAAMMNVTGWQKDKFGLVFSSFLLGYALMQIPAGLIADQVSTRWLLALTFCGFSLLTALTPLAAKTFLGLLLVRFLIGICEAVTFPAITSFNARWFTHLGYGRAQMLSVAGAPVGQMIAYPLTAWMVLRGYWPEAFYASALVGFLWIGVWLWYSTDYPQDHWAMDAGELQSIGAPIASDSARPLRFKALITSAPLLLISASAMGFSFVLWTFLFWLPTYLLQARGLSLAAVSICGVGIQGCGFLGLLWSGMASDAILRKTSRAHMARTKFGGACLALGIGFLLAGVSTRSTPACLVLLAIFYFWHMSSAVAYHTTPAALHPGQAGSIYGVLNCGANLGGVLGPAFVGFITTYGTSWKHSFEIVSVAGVLAATILFFVPIRRLDAADACTP